ncbi:MAG: TonB-dependent receptor [Thermoanaerobaculia bacterium]|nr:TonB-dependent receptor [Thermoanaerobaculia bacterium]
MPGTSTSSLLLSRIACCLTFLAVWSLHVEAVQAADGPVDAASSIAGQVVSGQGTPIEHAEVQVAASAGASGHLVFTGSSGEFSLQCQLPCTLLVSHPRFLETAFDVTSASLEAGETQITLMAKQAVFERIDVTAERSRSGVLRAPSVASTEVRPEDKAASPTTLVELVEGVAGVAENGQPGLFQVYSIRGVSRHRVLTFVDGIQVMGERRAGVATSFMDPLLMGEVDVLRGPSSTYYGSGALGGVVQIFPRFFEGLTLETGWEEFGDETWQMIGWGSAASGESPPADGWSVGIVRREADDDRVSDGTIQNTHFTQTSASLLKTWRENGREWEILLLPSVGDDLGKPNLDFPNDRVTNYPREEHLLGKIAVASDAGWSADLWIHPNSLETEVFRPGRSLALVENESLDLGGDVQWNWTGRGAASGLAGTIGVDWFGRRGVRADEREDDLRTGERTTVRTLDGDEDQVATFGSVRWSWGRTEFQAGSRLTWLRQSNAAADTLDDTAWTGFLGMVRPLGRGFEWAANVGTGLRFANLSERFFVGSTGRGQVIGNPDLEPEESLNIDVSLRFYGRTTFVSAQAFQLEIDDYIERISLDGGDTRTFVNVTSGTLEGFEIEGFTQLGKEWRIDWAGAIIDGEADDNTPLSDIAADRISFGFSYESERWRARLRYQLRADKNDPGPGEVAISGADLVSAAVSYDVTPKLRVTVRGENLLDEEYAASADDLSSPAPGRSVGLGLTWTRP